jgi:hypothetical protein
MTNDEQAKPQERQRPITVALIGAAAVVITALIGYWATTSSKSDPVLVDYTGKVEDAKSHKPIAKASVAITEDQKPPQRFATDSEGVFYARLSKSTETMLLEVQAGGYNDYSRVGPTVRTGSEEILLEPLATKPIEDLPKPTKPINDSPKPITWCDHSPTGTPYEYTFNFSPDEYLNGRTEESDFGPSAGWYVEWLAPGPVHNVSFIHQTLKVGAIKCGPAFGRETVAFCHGWKNDGGRYIVSMLTQWKQPCP